MPKVQRSRTFTAMALAAVAVLALGSAAVLAATTQVGIGETSGRYAFGPGKVMIAVGDTVQWQNNSDAPHTATSDTGAFDGNIAAETGSFSETFDTPGTFAYHCDIHPYMKGSVVVEAAGGGGGGGGTGGPSQPPTDTLVPMGSGGDGQAPLPLVVALLAVALGAALLAGRRFASVRDERD